MKQYRSYEHYRYSGIESIGEIPAHWNLNKLKYLCEINPNKSELKVSENTKVSFIPMANIISTGELDTSISKELGEVSGGYTYFRENDIIIAKVTPCFENGNVAIAKRLSNGIGFGTTELHVLRVLSESINKFIYYLVQSNRFKLEGIASMYGVGGLKRIPEDFVKNYKLSLPSINEQKFIANFLDQKTAEIDSLIADKEKLIDLLEEQRLAIINEAVTKGLNPDVKMKDSGVEWIGVIPEHWEIKRLKDCCYINPNKSELNNISDELEVTFLPMENIVSTGCIDTSLVRDISTVYNGYTYFKEDDIVIAKVTPCFENKNIAIAKELCNGIGFGTTELHVLRAKKNTCNNFIYFLLQSNRFMLEGVASMYGVAGLKRIPTEFIQNFKFAIPEYNTQLEIATYLGRKTKQILEIIREIRDQTQKLKEYRQSLIYEAVTGKIDVRNER